MNAPPDQVSLNQAPLNPAQFRAKWIKTARVIYWTVTSLFLLAMVSGAVAMLLALPANVEGITHLGYPAYLLKILGTAKLIGAIAVLQKRNRTLKDWGYAGFAILLIGASASHAFSGDPFIRILMPLILLLMVLMSHRQWKTRWM